MASPVTVPLGPAIADLIGVRAGDRNLIQATVKTKDGSPVDISGFEVTAQARAKATDVGPAPLTAVITVVDAAAGQISIRWPGDQVTAVLAGKAVWKGVWDLQLQEPGEDPVTICAGKLWAEADVTRPDPVVEPPEEIVP